MYQYDEYDQQLIEQRSAEFRSQVARRLDGKISEEEFKPIRLMNGLYLQLHAYMLRVAIPYGVLSSDQMRKLAYIADKYDRGYGHFTTRQNIQFNWPKLIETPDILDDLASAQMHAIQTSGNCIRNITSDPYAGVAIDEAVDPRPLCELLRQWSTLHPEFAWLPRKFKFAVTGAANDRAAIRLHDIGLQLRKDAVGSTVVDVWVGGGQGRTPKVAELIREGTSIDELLPYLQALMRVYNRHGRRDNKYKARIKILLAEAGIDKLQEMVNAEFLAIDHSGYPDIQSELNRIAMRFSLPDYQTEAAHSPNIVDAGPHNAEFRAWADRNVKSHRQPGYSIAVISLKPEGGVPGDATSDDMNIVADLAEKYSFSEIRVTHRQNLVLPHVQTTRLFALWSELTAAGLAEDNLDLPSDIIACPGLDYCSLATARSIPLAQNISTRIRGKEREAAAAAAAVAVAVAADRDIGDVSINISGCINACGHHHVANIGILGLDRAGIENYQITLGGRNDMNATVGERMGPGLTEAEVTPAIERVIDLYLDLRKPGENFSDTYGRLGKPQFKKVIYPEVDDNAAA